jgi:sialate O-acetylesterase
MMSRISSNMAAAMIVALAGGAAAARGDVRLGGGFEDHMVLQRDKELKVWGEASAGEKVEVSLGGQSATAQADDKGHWIAKLPPMQAATGLTMTVKGTKNELTIKDVAVGEVWVFSGQSNMCTDVGFSQCTKDQVPEANYPQVRFLDRESWVPCTPETVGRCCGVAYFFGREIYRTLKVPVGLIARAQSMSSIQVWTPREAYVEFPGLMADYRKQVADYLADLRKWADRQEKLLDSNLPVALGSYDAPYSQTAEWYEGNILPLANLAIRGFVWYQGEANVADGMFYTTRQKAMVACWRKAFGDMSLPFYFVQIAPTGFDMKRGQFLPLFWLAQMECTRQIPNCEISHSSDLGLSLHPEHKDYVGQRLARIALAKTYGAKDLEWAGPRFKSSAIEGGRIRVAFDHVGAGLVSKNGKPLDYFEIAGTDGRFVPADAAIDGQTVVVSSDKVLAPAYVRFAWKEMAMPNLLNKDSIPAYPFNSKFKPGPEDFERVPDPAKARQD